jgi:hypothetical protein
MANCPVCGKQVGFWEGDPTRRCKSCIEKRLLPNSDSTASTPNGASPSSNGETAGSGFAILAFAISGIVFVISVFASLVFMTSEQIVFGLIVLIGGIVCTTIIGLLAEISTNIAKLVNKNE